MRIVQSLFSAGIALTVACTAATPTPSPLTGQWGGRQVLLTLDTFGGRIEYDCGAGTIDKPLLLDSAGQFKGSGTHEDYVSGPTNPDAAPKIVGASYSGKVTGDQMTLAVTLAGDRTPRTFNLERGKNVKLIRCL